MKMPNVQKLKLTNAKRTSGDILLPVTEKILGLSYPVNPGLTVRDLPTIEEEAHVLCR
jgi:hypothetical protein